MTRLSKNMGTRFFSILIILTLHAVAWVKSDSLTINVGMTLDHLAAEDNARCTLVVIQEFPGFYIHLMFELGLCTLHMCGENRCIKDTNGKLFIADIFGVIVAKLYSNNKRTSINRSNFITCFKFTYFLDSF